MPHIPLACRLGGVMDPFPSALQQPSLMFSHLQTSRGGSRYIGRHAHGMIAKAGFSRQRQCPQPQSEISANAGGC